MSLSKRKGKSLTHRNDYRLYFVVLYPLVLLASIIAFPFRKTYSDDRKTGANIFTRAAGQLNATLPWLYMQR